DIAKNIDIYPLKKREQMDSGARKDIQKNKAFIIHGQEELPRYMVLDLLRRATDVEPVVLVDQPNSGRTIIEKLEDSLGDSAAYAVVIMSADDVGGRRDGHQSPRARQNVVLELGYAMARLGRRNITVLHGQDVEIPSDIQGVAYYPLDDGSWQNRLLGDLKAAGFDVHFDRL
ncbi:TIR domain-containing protein, partial [Kocuria subflava]